MNNSLDLAWDVARLQQQCEGIRLEAAQLRAEVDQLRRERDEALKTRNLAQKASSDNALEKQQLVVELGNVLAALQPFAKYIKARLTVFSQHSKYCYPEPRLHCNDVTAELRQVDWDYALSVYRRAEQSGRVEELAK